MIYYIMCVRVKIMYAKVGLLLVNERNPVGNRTLKLILSVFSICWYIGDYVAFLNLSKRNDKKDKASYYNSRRFATLILP